MRPHRVHEMRTIATDDPVAWASVTSLHLLQNGCAERGTVLGGDAWSPKEHCIGFRSYSDKVAKREGFGSLQNT